MRYAKIDIPKRIAMNVVQRGDPRLLISIPYAIKSTLAETFGEGLVRPWTLMENGRTAFRLFGWIPGNADEVELADQAESMGVRITLGDWFPPPGQAFDMDVLLAAEKNGRQRLPNSDRVLHFTQSLPTEGEGAFENIAAFVSRRVNVDGNGFGAPAAVTVRWANKLPVVVKLRGDVTEVLCSHARARIKINVSDDALFSSFVRRGIGKLKFQGFGCLVPTEIYSSMFVEQVDAAA